MRRRQIRVLVFEDDDYELDELVTLFSEAELPPVQVQYTDSIEAGIDWLQEDRTDVVLLKFPLEGYRGMTPLRRLRRHFPQMPIVVMTALDDEYHARDSIKNGAQDYVIQKQFTTQQLIRSLRTAMLRKRSDQKRARLVNLPLQSKEGLKAIVLQPNKIICAWCRNVRAHKNLWIPAGEYLKDYREKPLRHGFLPGLCPKCSQYTMRKRRSKQV